LALAKALPKENDADRQQQIMDMLKSQIQSGGQDHADQAEQLPQQVDTDNLHQLLQKFGINLQDLISRFTGGIPGM